MRCARLLAVLVAGSAASTAAAPPRFDPAQARPYFESGPAAEAAKRLRVEDWLGAAKRFDDYLRAQPKAADRRQAQFLAAYALSRAGHFADAAARFDALVASYPLLIDHHRLYAARADLAAKRFRDALERATKVDPTSSLDGEARIARAQAESALGDHPAAAKSYQGYLAAYPRSWREGEVRLRLGEELEQLGRWPEAREHYRWLWIHQPQEPFAARAATHLADHDKARAIELSGAERVERGLAYFEAMRNSDAERTLTDALASPDLDAVQRCVASYHLAQTVFKERDRPRAAPLFDAAIAACAPCAVGEQAAPACVDLHMKSLYQGGRCHAARHEEPLAVELFARAEADHPTHSYADDARLRGAEAWDTLAVRARALPIGTDGGTPESLEAKRDALLADLADRYPNGDVRSEALFRLFFSAWRAGRLSDAAARLQTSLAKVPREEGWWDAGRTLYWIGRVADKQGKPDEARDAWRRCAREYPLSYYALQSLNRLRERFPDDERALVEELRKPVPTDEDLRFQLKPRAIFGSPPFLRGVELARLGLGAEAKRELAAAGIHVPEKGQKIDSPEQEELLWAAAVLYDRAGEWALAHFIPRYIATAYARTWPVGDNVKRWRLSYPRGYADLIVPNAQANGQPVALEFAIVREESAFDPLTESFANAVGLTQLTPPPAKRFARGLPYTREALRDPSINVAIGARELGALWALYGGAAPLVIAGYNAGEGRVAQWRRAPDAAREIDEWIEAIPFDETRGYTKRVLSSFFAYHWLYEAGGADPVPSLPLPVPARH